MLFSEWIIQDSLSRKTWTNHSEIISQLLTVLLTVTVFPVMLLFHHIPSTTTFDCGAITVHHSIVLILNSFLVDLIITSSDFTSIVQSILFDAGLIIMSFFLLIQVQNIILKGKYIISNK
jgi:hypothetical protein